MDMNQSQSEQQLTASLPEFGRLCRKSLEILLFAVIVAMLFITPDPTNDIKYLLLSWGAYILAAIWIFRNRGKALRRPSLFLELLLVFLVLHLVASLLGGYVQNSGYELRKFWALFLLYLIASQSYAEAKHVRRLMLVVCIAVAVSSIYALVCQGHGMDPFPWGDRTSDTYTNLPGTFGNPNFAAHTLILAIVMAVFLATRARFIWCLGFAALFLAHLYYTHQRGGIVALCGATTLLIVALNVRRRVQRPVRAVIVTLVLTALLAVCGAGTLMAVSKMRGGSLYPLDLSLLVRYKSYCSAAKMILAKPLIGYGTGNYRIEYPPFWTPYEQRWFAQEIKMNTHVHNDLLEVAADAGLPAAGVYLAFLTLGMCYGLLIAFRETDRQRRLLGYMYAAFFCAFFIDGLFGFNLRVPVSAALLFAMAGTMEGVWSSARDAGRLKRTLQIPAWRALVLGVGLGCVLLDTCVYASQVLLQHSMLLKNSGQADEAIMMAEWAEDLSAGNWMATRQRALMLLEKQDWDAAIAAFNLSLDQNPNYILNLTDAARAGLGKALSVTIAKKDYAEAVTCLDAAAARAQRARQLAPMFAPAEDLLARIAAARALVSKNQNEPAAKTEAAWRESEQHFVAALENGARNTTELYNNLAEVRMSLGDAPGAEEAMLRATEADAKGMNWGLFYDFARSSRQYGKFLQAIQSRIERLGEKSPPDHEKMANAYLWLANIRAEGLGDFDNAELAYRNAISHSPDRPDLWRTYALFAKSNGRLQQFKDFLVKTNSDILSQGQKPLPHVMAMARLWKEGPDRLVEASALLGEAAQGKIPVPGLKPTELEMGWAVMMMADEARGVVITPVDTSIALLHLGIVSSSINDFKTAEQLFPESMTNLPEEMRPVALQHWADALLRQKRPDQAINLLQPIVLAEPQNAEVRLTLARTLAAAKRYPEARVEYKAVLALPNLPDALKNEAEGELGKLP
jgi:tetratricopeptide (TPR) repeat protein/O-antigen ligase